MTNRTNTYQSYSWEYKSQCSQDRFVVSLFCYVAYYYLDGGVFYHKESRENRDELVHAGGQPREHTQDLRQYGRDGI